MSYCEQDYGETLDVFSDHYLPDKGLSLSCQKGKSLSGAFLGK